MPTLRLIWLDIGLYWRIVQIMIEQKNKWWLTPISYKLLLIGVVVAFGAAFIVALYSWSDYGVGISGSVWSQRVDAALAPVKCMPIAKRQFPSSYYQGKMIDSHFHIASIPDWPAGEENSEDIEYAWLGDVITIDEIACTLSNEGTLAAFSFINVWTSIEEPSLQVAKRIMKRYPDLFVPFIQAPNDPRPMVEAPVLENMLSVFPGLFAGLGEIGFYGPENSVADPPPDDPLYLENYKVAREHNLMIYYHLGRGHQENLERVLRQNRDINFIFHGDTVTNEADVPRVVGEILSNNPNAFYTIDELYGNVWLLRPEVSKQEFMDHFSDYEPLIQTDLAWWKKLIESYPDQVMWGTDRGDQPAWSYDQDVGLLLTDYARAFIGRLEPSVQERFAYENAARLSQ